MRHTTPSSIHIILTSIQTMKKYIAGCHVGLVYSECVCSQYLFVGLGFLVSVAEPTSPSPLLLESLECCVCVGRGGRVSQLKVFLSSATL